MTMSNNTPEQKDSQNSKQRNPKTMKKKQTKLWFLIPLILFFGLVVILYMRLGKPTDIVTNTALERPVLSPMIICRISRFYLMFGAHGAQLALLSIRF